MIEAASGIQRIVEPMRAPIQSFSDTVTRVLGPNATTLAAFGSVVDGPFDPKRQTARSVVVLEQIYLDALRRLSGEGTRFGKSAIAAPLVMTPEYIKTSLDTFPVELLNIKLHHATLVGEDVFDALEFEDGHVRLQCERELKSTLIGLRQGLLASAGRDAFLGALEVDAADSLMRTLRGLLWLKGTREAKPGSEVLVEIEALADRKMPGIRASLDATAPHDWATFEKLYADVEQLGKVADAL